MPDCEICGEEQELIKAIVEGSLLSVCDQCAKFGNAILVKKEKPLEKQIKRSSSEIINVINQEYPKIIKESREKLGLKQKELALKINEKESIIHKLETGALQPTILMARKIEKTLNICLVEIYQESHESLNLMSDQLTLGDLLKLRQ